MTRTCGCAGSWGPGDPGRRAVQQVVPLQETVEGTEDGGAEHDGQRDRSSSGQRGEDEAPDSRNHRMSFIFIIFNHENKVNTLHQQEITIHGVQI